MSELENVYWCEAHQTIIASTEAKQKCAVCKKPMTNIGWFEERKGGN